jgi:hypothetical protein
LVDCDYSFSQILWIRFSRLHFLSILHCLCSFENRYIALLEHYSASDSITDDLFVAINVAAMVALATSSFTVAMAANAACFGKSLSVLFYGGVSE